MLEGVFTIRNRLGLHARAAAMFVKSAAKFNSNVLMEKDGMQVNGKSIMGLLTLEGYQGSILKVTATGSDAEEVLAEIQNLIDKKFFED